MDSRCRRLDSDHPLASDLQHVLDDTKNLWAELRGQRVFITGGSGFVGAWLLHSFIWACQSLDLDAEAVVLTRNPSVFRERLPEAAADPHVRTVVGDVRTFDFPTVSCRYVIHAAADGVGRRDPGNARMILDTVVDGTKQVLSYVRAAGVRKLLFVSSGAVYGRQAPTIRRMAETEASAPSPLDVTSAYAEAKRIAELLCLIESRCCGFELKVARAYTFVGPYLPLDGFAIGNFIQDALSDMPVRVRGDGTPRRSYLYASDLAVWLWTILFNGKSARAYNVGSESDISIEEVARLVAAGVTPNVPVLVERPRADAEAAERYVPDTSRARGELGLAERVGVADGIVRTLAWHKQRRAHPTPA